MVYIKFDPRGYMVYIWYGRLLLGLLHTLLFYIRSIEVQKDMQTLYFIVHTQASYSTVQT
jgi:hypothetical protein